jgi:hypothetical protein
MKAEKEEFPVMVMVAGLPVRMGPRGSTRRGTSPTTRRRWADLGGGPPRGGVKEVSGAEELSALESARGRCRLCWRRRRRARSAELPPCGRHSVARGPLPPVTATGVPRRIRRRTTGLRRRRIRPCAPPVRAGAFTRLRAASVPPI